MSGRRRRSQARTGLHHCARNQRRRRHGDFFRTGCGVPRPAHHPQHRHCARHCRGLAAVPGPGHAHRPATAALHGHHLRGGRPARNPARARRAGAGLGLGVLQRSAPPPALGDLGSASLSIAARDRHCDVHPDDLAAVPSRLRAGRHPGGRRPVCAVPVAAALRAAGVVRNPAADVAAGAAAVDSGRRDLLAPASHRSHRPRARLVRARPGPVPFLHALVRCRYQQVRHDGALRRARLRSDADARADAHGYDGYRAAHAGRTRAHAEQGSAGDPRGGAHRRARGAQCRPAPRNRRTPRGRSPHPDAARAARTVAPAHTRDRGAPRPRQHFPGGGAQHRGTPAGGFRRAMRSRSRLGGADREPHRGAQRTPRAGTCDERAGANSGRSEWPGALRGRGAGIRAGSAGRRLSVSAAPGARWPAFAGHGAAARRTRRRVRRAGGGAPRPAGIQQR